MVLVSDLQVQQVVTDPSTGEPMIAHICRKEEVARAYVTGEAIEALCGKKWVPSRDPERFPICPECKRIRSEGSG